MDFILCLLSDAIFCLEISHLSGSTKIIFPLFLVKFDSILMLANQSNCSMRYACDRFCLIHLIQSHELGTYFRSSLIFFMMIVVEKLCRFTVLFSCYDEVANTHVSTDDVLPWLVIFFWALISYHCFLNLMFIYWIEREILQ